jgi:hypothetical protein
MRHQNTVIHGLLKAIPRWRFDRVVKEKRGDYRDRSLSFWSQFAALIYAQLSGAQSLRDAVTSLASHRGLLYHLGIDPIARSTLSDANRDRPAGIFAAIFDLLLPQAVGKLRQETSEVVRLIDATSIRLSDVLSGWAHYKAGQAGAKLHLVFDPSATTPMYFSITPMRVNDIVEAKKISIEPGATYVFDLGYYDFGWWASLDEVGCRFVSRFKRNTPIAVVTELPVPKGELILSDRIGFLPQRMAKSRCNPLQHAVREVRVRTEKGEVLRLISNDLDASAEKIAELYKTRWQIELFFKWVKQNLRIKKFMGTSENAVRLQIIVALIAFLLIRIAHHTTGTTISLQDLARRMRANLLHRKTVADLLAAPSPPEKPPQFALDLRYA